jgi:tetratricopeptide (TPR) repeat protein
MHGVRDVKPPTYINLRWSESTPAVKFIPYISLIFLCLPIALRGQNQIKIDSLLLLVESEKDDSLKIEALFQISDHYYGSNYIQAIGYAEEAREHASKKGLKVLEAKSENRIANIFTAMNDYKSASIHYFAALKFYEEAADSLNILRMQNNLGVLYDRLLDYDKALKHYFVAREFYNRMNPDVRKQFALASLYNNIANIYQTKGDFKAALQYYNESLELAVENNQKAVQGIALNNLGKLHHLDLNEPEKAHEFLLRGLSVREELGDIGEIAKSHVILSDFYLRNSKLEEARKSAQRAIELGEKIGSLDIRKNAYSTLSEIEKARGNYAQALEAFQKYKTYNDSIQNQFASREITKLQLQYDFEKVEKQREEEARRSRLIFITTTGALSVSLVIAILITIIIRSKGRQAELERKNLAQDVDIKNKELTTNVMYLIRKNELINNVAERLLELKTSVRQENHKILHEIILDLQKEADSDTWKEFELRFNQVHSDFYLNLRKLYPGLSPADEKLCAFLRLNMTSKEIAAITQQSVKSIEVARARLRKKLNLTNTTSNLVTHLGNL